MVAYGSTRKQGDCHSPYRLTLESVEHHSGSTPLVKPVCSHPKFKGRGPRPYLSMRSGVRPGQRIHSCLLSTTGKESVSVATRSHRE